MITRRVAFLGACAVASCARHSLIYQYYTSLYSNFFIAEETWGKGDVSLRRIKTDKSGRPYASSEFNGVQILCATSSDHTWDKYGPVVLIAIQNASPDTVWIQDIAAYVLDSTTSEVVIPPPGIKVFTAEGIPEVVTQVTFEDRKNANDVAELASAVGGLALPVGRMNFTPAIQSLASVQVSTSSAQANTISDEAGDLVSSINTFMKGDVLDKKITSKNTEKGAVLLTHVIMKQPIGLLVALNKQPSFQKDGKYWWYESSKMKFFFKLNPVI